MRSGKHCRIGMRESTEVEGVGRISVTGATHVDDHRRYRTAVAILGTRPTNQEQIR